MKNWCFYFSPNLSYWVKLWEQFELLIRVKWVLVVCLFLDSWEDSFLNFKAKFHSKDKKLVYSSTSSFKTCVSLSATYVTNRPRFHWISICLVQKQESQSNSKLYLNQNIINIYYTVQKIDYWVMTKMSWWISL